MDGGWIEENVPIEEEGHELEVVIDSGTTIVLFVEFESPEVNEVGDGWIVGVEQRPRVELFAFSESSTPIQLTDEPLPEPRASVRWQPNDHALSWVAQQWWPPMGDDLNGGIERIDPDGNVRELILANRTTGPGHRRYSNSAPHWSPTGNHLVFRRSPTVLSGNPSDVWRATVDGSHATNLTKVDSGHPIPLGWRDQ